MTTIITSADNERSIVLSGTYEYQLSSNYIGKPPIQSTYIFANKCVVAAAEVRTREFHLHVGSLSIAAPTVTINSCGENGVTNINANDKSANAASAWPVLVSCHQLDEISKLHIKSRGGDGGGGFVPSDGNSPPGIGGDAGNGADITAWFECLVDTLGDLGEAALASTDAVEQLAMTEEFVEGAKTLTSPGSRLGCFEPHQHAACAEVKSMLKMLPNLINSVRRPSTSWVNVWPDYVTKDYRGGTPGKGSWCRNSHGDIHTGADGAPGKDGSLVHNRMHTAAIRASNECFIHPDQVALTLRDVENNYFIGSKQSLDTAQTTLKMLQARLAFSAELVPEDNLYKAYLSKEGTVLSVVRGADSMVPTSVLGIASSLDLSNRYMTRLGLGVDFYRHQLTWVPRGSYDVFEATLQQALADFQSIESDYEDYAQMAADNKQQRDQIGIGKNAAGQGLKLATSDLTTLAVELAESADHIAVMQGEIPIKRKALDDELDRIVSDIKSSFKFSFKDLLSAVSTMCFSPGLAIGAAQGVIQTATLLNGSAMQVKNDAGDAVSKDYVVEKVYALKAGLDGLQEHIELSADDPTLTTDDPNGNKLLGNEKDIMDLINQYRGVLGDEVDKFKKMFDDYVAFVLQRNNEVIHYNALITLYLEARNKQGSCRDTINMLGTQEASALNTNIPALAATIKANYMHHTSQVLEQLYNTQRALSFWSLSLGTADFGQLRDAGFPSPGLAARLKAMNDDIAADLVRAVDAFGMGRLTFGSTSENPDGEPVRIQLSEFQLKALKTPPQGSSTEYAVSIQIATASKDTSRETNPFAMDGYDIRVSKVRVYLEGVQTADNDVRVVMQHLGTETIVTPTNDLMPFKHDRLHLAFHYNSSTSKILTDGNIGRDDEEKKYALPRPFAMWRIGVPTASNVDLDMSGVTKATIEFSGYYRSF
ncbi:hypothetical protein LTR91_020418 [Friedmanniomyces endolithicus]|uniref:Uncharacterized protein n=1 Tax=Friedmanniomyces endolithicus TaxID=329885 RepID=A0AAN6H9D2_9PEZI|nr:hypothetical protein LTR94_005374 [Friedmanniomyces endolithicus]KAK0793500.1 hypothetical protein LTR59_008122 [Friedmanniomyces endolithicus]KAK0801480.1 hypothetical protein LTR38_006786 [Friedmanniomyces endolithicus]KAK0815515.1 hypothetical protein LTR75_003803 [Friedmanniomyces endolithicus]KAK0833426.1 hypothetical protein LTR03_014774 [Friedmanniomyces endolithicus]